MMKKFIWITLAVFIIATGVLSARFYTMGKQSRNIANAGLQNGTLQACPNRPSCVCSTDTADQHAIDAISIPAGTEDPINAVAEVIKAMPRTAIIKQESNYLHATFTSGLFRFVDDVELLLDGNVLQVRSVSRVGYSDLGANRKRVEAIRANFK